MAGMVVIRLAASLKRWQTKMHPIRLYQRD